MSVANPTYYYRATDSGGSVYTTSRTRPIAFCVVFVGGWGKTFWSNSQANAQKMVKQKRQLAKAPNTILTGRSVELLDAIAFTAEPRGPALTAAQRQEIYRVRRDAEAHGWRAALVAIEGADTIEQARYIARRAFDGPKIGVDGDASRD